MDREWGKMGFYCLGCKNLFAENQRLEKELDNERLAHSRTLNLLMSGEALREKLRLENILRVAYARPNNGQEVL